MPKKKKKTKNRNSSQKKLTPRSFFFFQRWIKIGVVSVIFLVILANVQTTQSLIAGTQTAVLGDDEKKTEEKKEENKGSENKQEEKKQEEQKKSEERQQEGQKKQQEQQKEAAKTTTNTGGSSSDSSGNKSGRSPELIKTKTETVSPSGLKMKTESEGKKQETEIETADGQKIKTKIEDDGTTKIEIENGSLKLKYKIENGQVVLKAENEQGEEVELADNQLDELENAVGEELNDDDIKVAPTTDNKLVVRKNNIAAVTDFPLSIDVETKQLIVTTPAGQKIVTILPDQAVQNLLATGIVTTVEKQSESIQDPVGTFDGVVKLEIRNDKVVYKVNGTKTHKMFGFIPVTTPVTAFVSADSGTPVAKQQSILTNIVDFLSP